MGKYDALFSPLKISENVTLKNRVIKTGQSTWYWDEEGYATQRLTDAYAAMAEGGAAAITAAGMLWEPAGKGLYGALYDDKYIPKLQEFNDAIHAYGCKTIAQIHHIGPAAWRVLGVTPIGPSELTEEEMPLSGDKVHALTKEEIKEKQDKIVAACIRAEKAGFDMIEIHAAHGYFLASFLSRVWNKRDDEYGTQSIENRCRIIVEIFNRVREACPDIVIGIRMNGQEWGAKNVMTIEESTAIAKYLESVGFQYISVSGYGFGKMPFRYCPDYFPYPTPEEHMKPYMDAYRGDGILHASAVAIKKAVNVPVITVGRIDEDRAAKFLEAGECDIIGVGRQFWADPAWLNKVRDGKLEDICRCNRCGSCNDPVTQPRICRVNPSLGRERELAIVPAETKKKVMVIGAGPAGMEAARVMSLRGHDVTIYDKRKKLGGRLRLATMIKGTETENPLHLLNWLETQIGKSNVKVKLGTQVTLDMIKQEKPDAVVVAQGGHYPVPTEKELPGINNRLVMSIEQLAKLCEPFMNIFGPQNLNTLTHAFLPVAKNIVILGGQIEGMQGAVFMKKRGRNITVLEESDKTFQQITQPYAERMPSWFEDNNIVVKTNVKYKEIVKNGIKIINAEGKEEFIPAGNILVMKSEVPNTKFADEIKKIVPETYCVGSVLGAAEGGLMKTAMRHGREIGVRV